MKILHLIYSFNTGGSERLIVDLANCQVLEHQVGLCIINNLYSETLLNELDNRVQTYRINRKKGSHNLCDVIRLNLYILKFRPDILHIHDSDAILYIPIRRFYHTLLTIHAPHLPLCGIRKFDRTVAISNAVAQAVEERGFSRPEVIYNGIVTHSIRHSKSHFQKDRPFKIVQIGRLEHLLKGQHLLLQALHNLLPTIPIIVDIIGEGSSESFLKQLAKELGVEEQVHFLGKLSSEDIYEQLSSYQLLVQPSLIEGFGLTIIEAMAAGIPTLVSNLSGPMEIIKDGRYGYSFEANNKDSLCLQLRKLIDHYEEISLFTDEARRYVEQKFDISNTEKAYMNLYNHCVYGKDTYRQ